ncbi:DUF1190 domain-containing protein [Microvirga aerilata]|uniref:DUF1190 domain-containing protein n=2 Tax=Microvirga aerilata TaxID=670292 RepID=A0A936Z6H1_9HYPH|nr:DUF1190 domain-containing protein [Microvirga aerilata]
MQPCSIYVLYAAILVSGLILSAFPLRAEPRTAVYVTSRACQTEGLLSPTECRNAFANAEAEFDNSIPVFDRQDECERHFRRCAISFAEAPNLKTLRYGPIMKGVQVSVISARERTVVPVLDGSHPMIRFSPRSVTERQDSRLSAQSHDASARMAAAVPPQGEQTRGEETWTLRGIVHNDPTQPLPSSLTPKLLEWCRRFCDAFTGRAGRGFVAGQPDPGLFYPHLSAGAQSGEPLTTLRFRPSVGPVSLSPPHFALPWEAGSDAQPMRSKESFSR